MEKCHFTNIAEHNEALGLAPPEHPLICVAHTKSKRDRIPIKCDDDIVLSSDFYSISLKRIISGEIFYGRTKYDSQEGTLIFTAPNQEISTKGIKVASEGRVILIHQDYLRGFPLHAQIKKYHFFSYAVHEALHMSPKEEAQIKGLFDAIECEYKNNQDEFTKELIIDLISTLLRFSNRYYHRQFLTRKEAESALFEKFKQELGIMLHRSSHGSLVIPEIEDIAEKLHVTPRYLSDALKVETGKTAKEWIHLELLDAAKELLLASNASVSEIAYKLGFTYPNYFARLFKKKVGMTPTEYRNQTTH